MSDSAEVALPYPSDEPAAVDTAAARCGRLAVLATRVSDDLAADGGLLRGSWQGTAAFACDAELRALVRLVRSLSAPLHHATGLLQAHAEVLHDARSRVDALRREYDDLLAAPDVHVAHRALLAVLRRRHQALLDEVGDHARLTARRVREAAAEVVPGGPSSGRPVGGAGEHLAGLLPLLAAWRSRAGVGCTPPPTGSPTHVVQAWWAALTPDEQARVVDRFAAQVGGLDGLPVSVRSAANERQLAQDTAMLRAKDALTDDERRWLHNAELVQQQLVRTRADEDPLTLEPLTAQLLVFDPKAYDYEGRAAVVVGDADTADNLAFLVPGLGSTVDSAMSSLTSNAVRVAQDARRLSPSETTATVAWMGYDAPGLGNVASDDAAENGSVLLAGDVLAVQAARAVTPHLTVVGHSYGSTTVGTMLRDVETGADDVVFVGSPGPDVEDADELRVPDGHVFVGASSRDPVSYLDRFGKDPSHESFGAIRFEAEDPTRNSWRLDLDDHSKYYDEGTESLANIVHVVTGDYDGVVAAPYREEWWLLPDGINADPESDREPTTVP